MFVRTKTFVNKDGSKRVYLQIAKSVWENGKPRQKVICTLGRLKELKKGSIDMLIQGLAKFSEKLTVIEASKDLLGESSKDYGSVLIFHRLFKLLGLEDILEVYLAHHNMSFPVREGIFAMVLNRILSPSSKLRVYEWLDDVYDPHLENLQLQHLYRSLDFLDKHKEKIEESLFEKVKNLFNLTLDVVFYDTTSIYFEGEGPEVLGAKGFSRDHRPDTNQVIIGIIMTGEGIPIGCEVFPGNVYDSKTLKTALDTLSRRFRIGRVIFVADRGMVSEDNLSSIEKEDYEYIVGVKMRGLKKVRDRVLSTRGRYKKIEDNLKVKETVLDDVRYIICSNPEEAERDRKERDEIIENLQEKIRTGSLTRILTGDAKRFCKIEAEKIMLNKAKIQKESRYDGKYVLQTNADLSSEEIARAYKNLWMIEHAFRDIKDIFKIRPVFHWTPSRVRGHIFICFLAFLLTVSLQRKLSEIGVKESVWKVIRDVHRMKAIKLFIKDKAYLVRTELQALAHKAFRAVGLRVPARVQEL
jgi:transposase